MQTERQQNALGRRARGTIGLVAAILFVAALLLAYCTLELGLPGQRTEAPATAFSAAIGATVEPLDRATALVLGIDTRGRGLVVTSVASDGPATRAGIRPGDVIERIGVRPVVSIEEAARALKDSPYSVVMRLNRGGHYVIVRLAASPPRGDQAKQGDVR